jgi:hypothetical protein
MCTPVRTLFGGLEAKRVLDAAEARAVAAETNASQLRTTIGDVEAVIPVVSDPQTVNSES